jgi:valyl-tRNA synthetase
MPFITEELYESIAKRDKNDLLISAKWPEYPVSLKNAEAAEEISWMIRCISDIRSVRADMNVPPKAMINLVVKDASAETKKRFAAYEEILKRMARIETIEFSANIPKGSIQTILDEATLALPIADIIDIDKERERLRKELKKLEQDIEKVDQKLGNEQFVSNAPEEIILEHKQRKETAESTHRKFSQALKQLEAV